MSLLQLTGSVQCLRSSLKSLTLWTIYANFATLLSFRVFRIMDDDRNRSLDFSEFKKGMREYGLYLDPKVLL